VDKDRKPLQEREVFIAREKARLQPWGEFTPASITEMAGLGLPVFLYELTPSGFEEIPKETRYIKIGEDKTSVRLVVFDKEIPGVALFHLPEKTLSAFEQEEKEVKARLNDIETRMRNLADRRPALVKEITTIERDVEFETAIANLQKAENVPEEQGFSYVTGFVPVEDMGNLKRTAAENNWAVLAVVPAPDEMVPTKLKNNKFVQLFYPLSGFLDLTPAYREPDISLWFLVFFTVFFAMIFGDAGYGLLLLLMVTVGIIKTVKTGVPQALKLFFMLGVSNVIWGTLTCTWFGIELEYLPSLLKDISLSYISPAKGTDPQVVTQNLQLFCFSLGLLHLTIAHIIGIIRYRKSLRLFGEIGSLAMLWGLYNVVLSLVASNATRSFPMLPVSLYLIGGGFVLTFIFNSYEGNLGKSILASCQNFIGMVLSITSAFADIMSYIRLWAVGLAGVAIASTINTMAGPMLGNFLIFAGIILLFAGHGLNFVLAAMGVLVHGVRLNTLEFSAHVGITWSGIKYKPFAEKR
jgi:V/A-type H+-transporting ATPase subunit I